MAQVRDDAYVRGAFPSRPHRWQQTSDSVLFLTASSRSCSETGSPFLRPEKIKDSLYWIPHPRYRSFEVISNKGVSGSEGIEQDFSGYMNTGVPFGWPLSLCIFFFFFFCSVRAGVIFAYVSHLTMCFPSPTSSSCPAGLHVNKLLRGQ